MWEYIIFVILQALSLAGGQAMFKLFVDKLGEGGWAYQNLRTTSINNWWVLALMVLFFGASFALWAYVVKKMDFSQAYPLSSLSFIFGMFLAFFLFQESIPFTRWIGVVLIVVGCVLISMK
jgi:undecaprenyl phosphate-alpha-L-ara4N flippase subunit ArnE